MMSEPGHASHLYSQTSLRVGEHFSKLRKGVSWLCLLLADEARPEQNFKAMETLNNDSDDVVDGPSKVNSFQRAGQTCSNKAKRQEIPIR